MHKTYPMSDLQRDWFDRENQHRNPDLIVQVQQQLDGHVDAEAFRAAATEVIDAADALRTTLDVEDGVHVQRVWEHALDGTIYVEDLTGLPAEQAQEQVLQMMAGERWHHFDFTTGPLVRIGLVQVTPSYAVVSLVAHHIIADGWSMGLVIANLADAYARHLAKGGPAQDAAVPAPTPMQLHEWVDQEARANGSPASDNSLTYWREALADVEPVHLPYDHELEVPERHSRSWARFSVPDELANALTASSARLSVMPSATLLTAYLRALAAAAGRRSVATLYLVSRRTRQNAGVVGCLINSIVIPLQVTDDRAADVRAVQRALLNGHRHQGVFIERVLSECKLPTRGIDAIFIFDKADYGYGTTFGPHVSSRFKDRNPPRPDRIGNWWENCTFRVVHEGDRIHGSISYNGLAYQDATMQQFVVFFLEELTLIARTGEASASAN